MAWGSRRSTTSCRRRRIEVESELGIGTTFRVSLPRIEDSSIPSVPIFHYSPQSGHQTILVVEDNGTVRQAVWGILRECGYSVLEASTGPEALAVARAHDGPIDLLLDLGLPGFKRAHGRTALTKQATGFEMPLHVGL